MFDFAALLYSVLLGSCGFNVLASILLHPIGAKCQLTYQILPQTRRPSMSPVKV